LRSHEGYWQGLLALEALVGPLEEQDQVDLLSGSVLDKSPGASGKQSKKVFEKDKVQ
jgi:hypothetical protein